MALGIITSKGIEPLKDALLNEKESNIREAAAWTLGRIGKHSGQHARSMAEKDILSILLEVKNIFCLFFKLFRLSQPKTMATRTTTKTKASLRNSAPSAKPH